METYYLVDYENVGTDGVSKCSGLIKSDYLHIFYTDKSKKIDLDIVNNHGNAVLETHKVPVKSQSVDMHIVSYLGYLLGKNSGKDISVVIISKDKDYDNILSFWKTKNSKLLRMAKIEGENKQNTKASNKKIMSNSTEPKKNKKPTMSEQKVKLNSEIQKALSKAKYEKKAINTVAKIVVQNYGKDNFKRNVHNELSHHYADFETIYKEIKPILSKY